MTEDKVNAEALRDAEVVILANCGGLNEAQFKALRDFVAAGGGLLIFPGDKVNPDAYNKQFFPVPGPQKEALTAATLGPAEGDPDEARDLRAARLGRLRPPRALGLRRARRPLPDHGARSPGGSRSS